MRKHPRWGKNRIAFYYFLRKPILLKKVNPEEDIAWSLKPLK